MVVKGGDVGRRCPAKLDTPCHVHTDADSGSGMLCIQLQLKPGNLGGSPVYCYEDDFVERHQVIKLLAEYSNVE